MAAGGANEELLKPPITVIGQLEPRDRMIAIGIYWITGLLGICLCLRGLHSVTRAVCKPRHILYSHLYLANLSICMCSLVAGFSTYKGRWPFAESHCQMYATLAFFGGMASILFTALLAVEAYLAVSCRDTYAGLTPKFYHGSAMLVWGMAAFWSVAPLVGWSSYSLEPVGIACEISFMRTDSNHVTFLASLVALGYAVPFGLAGVLLALSWCKPPSLTKGNHAKAILKASTLHIVSSILAWSPYAVLCFIPFIWSHIALSPLAVLGPSITTKTVVAFQGLILPRCSAQLDGDQPKKSEKKTD